MALLAALCINVYIVCIFVSHNRTFALEDFNTSRSTFPEPHLGLQLLVKGILFNC